MLEKECEQCAGNGRAKIAVKTGKVVKVIDGVTVLPTMFDGETLRRHHRDTFLRLKVPIA